MCRQKVYNILLLWWGCAWQRGLQKSEGQFERNLLMRKPINKWSSFIWVTVCVCVFMQLSSSQVQFWNQISGVSFIQCGSTTNLRLFVNWRRIEAWAVWNCYRNAYMGWFSLSVLSSWCGGVMSNTHLCIIDISQHISLPVIVNRERCLQASIQDRWHITGHFTSGIKTDKNDIINHSKKQKHLRQLQLMHILE